MDRLRIIGCTLALAGVLSATSARADERYGFCMAAMGDKATRQWKNFTTGVFTTPWPVIQSLESRYVAYLVPKYNVYESSVDCPTYPAKADADAALAQRKSGQSLIATDWTPAP